MTNVSGSIHLKFQWRGGKLGGGSGSRSGGGDDDHENGSIETDTLLGDGDNAPKSGFMTSTANEDPEFASQPPNELRIIVVQARNLLAMDTGMFASGLSDPYAKIKLAGCQTKKTKYLPKTLDPIWNEAFTLEQVTDKTRSFEVIVYDHDRLRYPKYLIKLRITFLHQYVYIYIYICMYLLH